MPRTPLALLAIALPLLAPVIALSATRSSVRVDGAQHPYSYDERTQVLRIERTEMIVDAEVT